MNLSGWKWVVFALIMVSAARSEARAFSVERKDNGEGILQKAHSILGEERKKAPSGLREKADPTNGLSLEQHLEKIAGCHQVDFSFDDSKGVKYRAGMKELISVKKEIDGTNLKFRMSHTAVVDDEAYGDDSIVQSYQKRKKSSDNPSPVRFQHSTEVWSTKGDGAWKKETFGPFGNKVFECNLDTAGPVPRCRVERARIPRRDRDVGRVRTDYKTMSFTETMRFADSGDFHRVAHEVEKLDGSGKVVSIETGLISYRLLEPRQCEATPVP